MIIGEDAFHYEETLYLSKSDGYVYYENFANQSIKVAISLWGIWNFLFDKYRDVREEMEVLRIGQKRVVPLMKTVFQKSSNTRQATKRRTFGVSLEFLAN